MTPSEGFIPGCSTFRILEDPLLRYSKCTPLIHLEDVLLRIDAPPHQSIIYTQFPKLIHNNAYLRILLLCYILLSSVVLPAPR